MKPEVPILWGEDKRGWHIDKTISVSDLISIALIVIPALIWASTVESRFAVVSEKASNVDRQRVEDRQATETKFNDLQQQIRGMDTRVNDRLEKIADKVGANK